MTDTLPTGYAWEDAPSRGGRSGTSKYLEILGTLQANPGRTLRLPLFETRSKAETARKSIRSAVADPAEWSLVTREVADGMVGVYVTFNGKPVESTDLLG